LKKLGVWPKNVEDYLQQSFSLTNIALKIFNKKVPMFRRKVIHRAVLSPQNYELRHFFFENYY